MFDLFQCKEEAKKRYLCDTTEFSTLRQGQEDKCQFNGQLAWSSRGCTIAAPPSDNTTNATSNAPVAAPKEVLPECSNEDTETWGECV